MITTHPPILRILRIHQAIQGRTYPTVPSLMRLLGASRRAVQRDIEFLRNQMGAPLAFNAIENGYEYTEEGFTLPDVKMTEGEVLALMVADKALAAYRGTASEELLRQLIEKATLALGETRMVSPQQIAEGYSFQRNAPPAQVNSAIFGVIEKAIRDHETLDVVYHTQSRGTTSRRNLDPYHLANVDGDWYLLAFCHRIQRMRTFKPARIREVRGTGVTFVARPFDPEQFLRTKLHAMGGERIIEAVLRFDSTLGSHILERDWGSGYRVQILTNGGVELSFRSENVDALVRWCLSWGPGAEIVSPSWVRRRARQILRQITRRYEGRVRPVKTVERRQRPPSRPPSN